MKKDDGLNAARGIIAGAILGTMLWCFLFGAFYTVYWIFKLLF